MNSEIHVSVQDDSPARSGRQKCKTCCKTFTASLFSTVGLCCLVVGYSIFGGFIFMKLEAPYEKRLKNDVQSMRHHHVQRLWNITNELNVLFKDNWTRIAEAVLRNFSDEVYDATKRRGWDGKDGDADIQWTFAGALLYSLTVITTIGYGHIAPRTAWGRVVTILYAVFGIPLTLLFMANMGTIMANAFRFLYNNIFCGVCCLCFKKRKKREPNARAVSVRDSKERKKNGDPSCTQRLTDTTEPGQGPAPNIPPKSRFRTVWSNVQAQLFPKDQDITKLSVPLSVCMFLIAGYIFGGALLFTLWEKDWDLLVGSYFCFITLTTIGFGDIVPGTSTDSWSNQEKLVLCALYLVFGLSLLAMCFQLMQEEVRNKCIRFGKWIGILK